MNIFAKKKILVATDTILRYIGIHGNQMHAIGETEK
jgi:hypothetical protein